MSNFRIYVAGAWPAREEIREYQKILTQNIPNAVITHDWTQSESIGWSERTKEDNDKFAELDLWKGVGSADCVVAIKTRKDYAYRGTEREIGFAQGRGIPVFILAHNDLDSYVCKNVFYHLTRGQTTYEKWEPLMDAVVKLANKKANSGKLLREMLHEEC